MPLMPYNSAHLLQKALITILRRTILRPACINYRRFRMQSLTILPTIFSNLLRVHWMRRLTLLTSPLFALAGHLRLLRGFLV